MGVNWSAVFRLIEAKPQFSSHLARLKVANIKPKPWWFPYKRFYSTVFNTVYYPKSAEFDPIISVAAIMVHEAVHLLQWDRLKPAHFMARYAQAQGRLALEKPAFSAGFLWYILHNKIINPKMTSDPKKYYSTHPHVGGPMMTLIKHYKIKHIETFDSLMDWATAEITRLYGP